MDSTYRVRGAIIVAMIVLIAFLYTGRLFALQLTGDDEVVYTEANTTTHSTTVAAARGEVLDRHGNVLISNRATYAVTVDTFSLLNSEDTNGYLLSIAKACQKLGIEYNDNLPLSDTEPYTYTLDELSSSQLYYYKKFMQAREWDSDMTEENFVAKLKKAYEIDDSYTEEEARIIMGMRYELDLPRYAYADTYEVISDISADQLAVIKEIGVPGMEVITSTVREYQTPYAAQLLGHVGYLSDYEYENTYKDLGYAMDATVGKDGFEEAFEQYLHGTDGIKVTTTASDGTIVDEYWEVEPQTGSNVITTIDIGLQAVAEQALAERIQSMAEGKMEGQDGYDASSGAVVVMDVNNFEVLAAANYPTYDGREYTEKYDEMLEDEDQPLANRALMYAFAPGSTFKMITSIAGMRAGIDPDDTIEANGIYTKYEEDGYAPKCWIYTESGIGHGTVDMYTALEKSCNIYFYTVGDALTWEPIAEVAKSFGVGESTGIEMIEETGRMAGPEVKEALYTGIDSGWYAADNLMLAIGQSDTTMTPLQLCRYVATIANRGTQYNATFFRRAVSSDFQSLVAQNTYPVTATDLISEEEFQVLYTGMRLCATDGTAAKYLSDTDLELCCKTGTAQHGLGGSDNAAFVCWAPADDPEIAVAVYVEHGNTGGYYAQVALDIMEYYFDTKDAVQETKTENNLLTTE